MNNKQKFFKGMASFATAFLIVGIISAVVSIIAIAYLAQNIFIVALYGVGSIFLIIALYYLLQGAAYIGYRVYGNVTPPPAPPLMSEHLVPGNEKK